MTTFSFLSRPLAVFLAGLLFLWGGTARAHGTAPLKAHPYLFYTPGRIDRLKRNLKEDTLLSSAWQQIKNSADKGAASGKGSLEELSLAWSMTGDKKYAEAVRKSLLQLVARPAWDGLDDRSPRWNSALGTAHTNFLAATAYDAVYDYLSREDRRRIADGIVKLGIEPSLGDWISADKRLHALNSMGHNWWSALVFQAGIASLAVMNEVPQARGWAEEVMRASREWFAFAGSVLENKPSTFDPAGGFYESVNYANFGVSEYLFFRLAWTNALGPVKMPYDPLLEKTMDWFIHASYPARGQLSSVNFGDGSLSSNGDRPVKLMIALGYDKDRYRWYLAETAKGKIHEDLAVNTPLGLLYAPEKRAVPPSPGLATSSLYPGMGWAMLRSSWDKNATMLGVKSGYTWNHAHADAGSFILFHRGRNLLTDGGNVNYGNPAYSGYSVRSEAHNVVLFNGRAQEPQDQFHGVKNVGGLHHLMDAGAFKYLLADATGPTARHFLRNYRNFLWVDNVILVIDDLKAYEYGKFEWLLHTADSARKKGIDLEVTSDTASVLVRPLFPETLPNGYPHDFPEKMRLEERSGVKDHDPKTMVPYYSLFPPGQHQQTKFITALILLDEHNNPVEGSLSAMASAREMRSNLPKIERLEGAGYIGVRITQGGSVTDVYVNLVADGRIMHRNSHNTLAGWETDAYIMALTYPEKKDGTNPDDITRYFVGNGSYLRKDGRVVLHSLSKVFLHAAAGSETRVLLQGQPVIHAQLRLKEKPSAVVLNGQKVPAAYRSADNLLVLDVEEEGVPGARP